MNLIQNKGKAQGCGGN